jgi:hypothetical protein
MRAELEELRAANALLRRENASCHDQVKELKKRSAVSSSPQRLLLLSLVCSESALFLRLGQKESDINNLEAS